MKNILKWMASALIFFCCLACTDDKPGQDPKEEYSTGLISLYLRPGNLINTRAGLPSTGDTFDRESDIRNIRVILYGLDGKAEYVRDYDPANASQWVSNSYPIYKTKPFEIARTDYSIAVLINYKNDASANYTTDIDFRTKNTGHSINALTEPLDFTNTPDTRSSVAQALTGIKESSPGLLLVPSEWDNSAFFMSNADGLVELTKKDIYQTETEALENPEIMRVERAISKVALFKSNAFKNPEGKLSIDESKGIQWRIDVTNKYVRPVRQITYTAPYTRHKEFGEMEDINTDRFDRYAIDPNYDGISHERYLYHGKEVPPGTPDPHTVFYGIDDDDMKLTLTDYVDDKTPPELLGVEYIPENAMAAEEQYEDVTSSLIIKLVMAWESEYEYFTYNNDVYDVNDVYNHLNNWDYIPGLSPLEPYEDELLRFFFSEAPVPTESKSLHGLNFYVDGTHYFRIPIRHFSDNQSPTYQTGYGRYGLIRNNYYKLVLTEILGYGSAVIPDPKGPDDKDKKLTIAFEIMPWNFRTSGSSIGEPVEEWPPKPIDD